MGVEIRGNGEVYRWQEREEKGPGSAWSSSNSLLDLLEIWTWGRGNNNSCTYVDKGPAAQSEKRTENI